LEKPEKCFPGKTPLEKNRFSSFFSWWLKEENALVNDEPDASDDAKTMFVN
jgi:hypothetical protein